MNKLQQHVMEMSLINTTLSVSIILCLSFYVYICLSLK